MGYYNIIIIMLSTYFAQYPGLRLAQSASPLAKPVPSKNLLRSTPWDLKNLTILII
jgi:hypothetical protein